MLPGTVQLIPHLENEFVHGSVDDRIEHRDHCEAEMMMLSSTLCEQNIEAQPHAWRDLQLNSCACANLA